MDKIKMNFPPSYVENYVKKWQENAKAKDTPPAELAMIEDIVTMVGIARGVMKPQPKS